MSSDDKRLSKEQIAEQQKKKQAEKCDYLHPEECTQEKDSLANTRKQVEKEADQFIDEKNQSDQKQQ